MKLIRKKLKFQNIKEELYGIINKKKESYNEIYAKLYEELFWKKSKYIMKIVIMYNKNEKFEKMLKKL